MIVPVLHARSDFVLRLPIAIAFRVARDLGCAEAPLFIAMRATDPLQDLLYFAPDPWPWGKPHEAAGLSSRC